MDETAIVEKLTRVEERVEQNTKDIKAIDDKVDNFNKLATSVEVMANNMGYMKSSVEDIKTKVVSVEKGQNEMKQEILEIKAFPDKENSAKWKKVVTYVCTALGGGILTYLISQFLPNLQ